MKPAATVDTPADTTAGSCRWCDFEVRRGDSGRLVHTGTGEGYCADGRHVAELRAAAASPPRVQCRLCKTWYAAADTVDHWSECPGPPPLPPPSTGKKR